MDVFSLKIFILFLLINVLSVFFYGWLCRFSDRESDMTTSHHDYVQRIRMLHKPAFRVRQTKGYTPLNHSPLLLAIFSLKILKKCKQVMVL